jgi:sortase A
MKLVVNRKALRDFLRWNQRVFAACATLALAYCAFALVDGWIFQNRERRRLEQLLSDRQAAKPGARQTESATLPQTPAPALTDGLIGRIAIPRLGLSAILLEGTSTSTLRRAAGHIAGTALPGGRGNVGIAGHRDTYFRPLRNIRRYDIITLTTLLGEYRYLVVSTRVVSPTDVAVLDSSDSEILTLVTCYPFYFVGAAPNRFIVRAERIESSSDASGNPLFLRSGVFRAQIH